MRRLTLAALLLTREVTSLPVELRPLTPNRVEAASGAKQIVPQNYSFDLVHDHRDSAW